MVYIAWTHSCFSFQVQFSFPGYYIYVDFLCVFCLILWTCMSWNMPHQAQNPGDACSVLWRPLRRPGLLQCSPPICRILGVLKYIHKCITPACPSLPPHPNPTYSTPPHPFSLPPSFPFPGATLGPISSQGIWEHCQLPQRVHAEPGRQTLIVAFGAENYHAIGDTKSTNNHLYHSLTHSLLRLTSWGS